MSRDAVLICTNADKTAANAACNAAGLEGDENIGVALSNDDGATLTHWGGNAAGITSQQYDDLADPAIGAFGGGNPHGRIMHDGEVNGFWDALSMHSLVLYQFPE